MKTRVIKKDGRFIPQRRIFYFIWTDEFKIENGRQKMSTSCKDSAYDFIKEHTKTNKKPTKNRRNT